MAFAAVLAFTAILPAQAHAAPASVEASRKPVPLVLVQPPVGLDEATQRATDLQQEMDDLTAEMKAVEARIAQTGQRIDEQGLLVIKTNEDRQLAQAQFDDRVVNLYKAGTVSPLEMLFTAPTLNDALNRSVFLMTMIERDEQALQLATKLSAEAAYQAKVLDDLRAQDIALRDIARARMAALADAVAQQKQVVAALSAQQKAYVASKSRFDAEQRRLWKESSYLGGPVQHVAAVVEPYLDRTYLVDEGEPTRYVTTGAISTQLCSWYSNAENGLTTASGRAYNENEFTCASVMKDPTDPTGQRLIPFGTRLAITKGAHRIIVIVTDRGPYVANRTIDLSKAAANALGFDGVGLLNVEVVSPK